MTLVGTVESIGTEESSEAGLSAFLNPSSVAIVGVSTGKSGLGYSTLKTLKRFGFPGKLVVVHPKATEIDGTNCFSSLESVPHQIDLALLFTSGDQILASVADAAAAGVKAVVIFASGFSESGGDGLVLQQEIVDLARMAGIRILGPNCQGVVATSNSLAATFSNALWADDIRAGSTIAYIGQSGAIGGSLFDLGRERGFTPAVWVTTGNQADVTVVEMAEHVLENDDIRVLMLYLETVPHGFDWRRLCDRATELKKQIVLLRSGTTHAGRDAVASHTGSLVGGGEAFKLLSQGCGVITVSDVNELVDVAMSWESSELPTGNGLGIVTTSGGAGGLAADLAEGVGLRIATLAPETVDIITGLLSDFATPQNPVDVTADLVARSPGQLGRVCQVVESDPNVDHLLVVVSAVVGGNARAMARSIVEDSANFRGRISVVYLASHDRTLDVRKVFADGGLPVFDSISSAVNVLGRLARHRSVAAKRKTPKPSSGNGKVHQVVAMTEARGTAFMRAAGISVPVGELAADRQHAELVAARLGDNLVLKVQSPQILHKTELGLVRLDVPAISVGPLFDELIAKANAAMPGASIEGVLIQQLASKGVELLIDVRVQENGYPPVLTVGIGGIFVELYSDVTTALLPIDEHGALEMLEKLHGFPLLNGFRGAEQMDVSAAVRSIMATAGMAESLGDQLLEIEINPLFVHVQGSGATAVDFVAYLIDGQTTDGAP